jgi:ketosteroid isomerase-like protein
MKRFCVLLLALVAGCSLLALSPKSKQSGDGVEKAIMQLEDASREAALKGDPSFAEKNLADDFVRINADGKVLNKQEFIDNFKKTKYESIDFADRKVRVYGDSAVVTTTANVKGTSDGKDISGPYRSARVWAKVKGQWKLVNFQSTRVAQ